MGLDAKTYWLTDRQSQCDFDFDFELRDGARRQDLLTDWPSVAMWVQGQKSRTDYERVLEICGVSRLAIAL
jgi:hypothetical protein